MSGEFRDRIAKAVDQVDQHEPWWSLTSAEVADAILAMPEMQSIRDTLIWVVECFGTANDELPDSVYNWVCDDDEERHD